MWAEQSRKAIEMPKRATDLDPNSDSASVPVNPWLHFLEVANSVNPPIQPYCNTLVTLNQSIGWEVTCLSNRTFSGTVLQNYLELHTKPGHARVRVGILSDFRFSLSTIVTFSRSPTSAALSPFWPEGELLWPHMAKLFKRRLSKADGPLVTHSFLYLYATALSLLGTAGQRLHEALVRHLLHQSSALLLCVNSPYSQWFLFSRVLSSLSLLSLGILSLSSLGYTCLDST